MASLELNTTFCPSQKVVVVAAEITGAVMVDIAFIVNNAVIAFIISLIACVVLYFGFNALEFAIKSAIGFKQVIVSVKTFRSGTAPFLITENKSSLHKNF